MQLAALRAQLNAYTLGRGVDPNLSQAAAWLAQI